MELYSFKETLLGFLSDVTNISSDAKQWFLGETSSFKPKHAPNRYVVLNPFVLVRVEESTRKVERPTRIIDGATGEEEKVTETEIFLSNIRFKIFTEEHSYSISAVWKDYQPTYLGCIASTRTPRPGEDWTRGNDLPDGYFCKETWEHIKNKILRYELKGLSELLVNGHYDKPQADLPVHIDKSGTIEQ